MAKMIDQYLNRISDIYLRGDAREESYYSALEYLIKACGTKFKKDIAITTLPKQTDAGNPDFRVWDGELAVTGYIEAKKPEQGDLDTIEESEQLDRYIKTFPNVILTNFFEFRLYRDHKPLAVKKVTIAKASILLRLKTAPPQINVESFFELISLFFDFSLPKLTSAKELAMELAKRTRFLRQNVIEPELAKGNENQLQGYYEAFERHLISGLDKNDFADLFAQTITYGLFAARTRAKGKTFSRKTAYEFIPPTIGVLKETFQFISLEGITQDMAATVDDISHVLASAELETIIADYYKRGKGEDPIVPFYEDFLAAYDKDKRKARGVYYTPVPVVKFIVNSVNELLKNKYKRIEGLADRSVSILDPASGTATFLAEAVEIAVDEFCRIHGDGKKTDFIREHILQHFFGFELLMAPYTLGHLKLSIILEKHGYAFQDKDRFQLFLTNTLEMLEHTQSNLPLVRSIAEESRKAYGVKSKTPILVIIGNPPYAGHSANASERLVPARDIKGNEVWSSGKRKMTKEKTWIGKLIDDYKFVDGAKLKEKNPKWLQDDYVKFIRFAQWKIEQNGEGILGFITNHSYLDNPTFRGMRQSLMKTFDEIYILDLHGNSLKKEKTPEGGKDDNVFDIRQGVAVAVMMKFRENAKE